ncbi:putative global regulator [Actinomyces bovis]|uniref:Global regulator n=1 Tax=Actinomyces bovis TaxID=1658 RepID=A0ABY1VMQ1_9ACTO|nr:folate-binding protein [Actinomyces bovis]SPT53032.1 putative global regulator [Actinomyces bovis]VEG55306.1 putative global regulator [Actinomyces israelii]
MRRSALLDWPGAIAAPNAEGLADAAVPTHFGSPLREQAALLEGRAVTALACDVVAVSGPDRLSWLTTLSSQVHTALHPEHPGVEALILDAQGRIRHAYAALDDGTATYLLTDAGRGPGLADFLDSMRFMLRVEVLPREDLAVLGSMGQGRQALESAALVVGALVGTWQDPWPGVVEGGTAYDVGLGSPERPFKHPGEGWAAGLVLVRADAVLEVAQAFLHGAGTAPSAASAGVAAEAERGEACTGVSAAGGTAAAGMPAVPQPTTPSTGRRGLAGALAWEALRLEAGRPRLAQEVDERAIPNELDWLRTAVHLSKGCYPGQETVARTLNLGRPPRRLSILQLDGLGGELPAAGATVRLGERTVGVVTSVAQHHELGPIALALLRRNTPLEAELLVEVAPAGAEAGGAKDGGAARDEPVPGVAVGLVVAAAQEPLVSVEGKARVSPQERPGAGLRPVAATRPGLLR